MTNRNSGDHGALCAIEIVLKSAAVIVMRSLSRLNYLSLYRMKAFYIEVFKEPPQYMKCILLDPIMSKCSRAINTILLYRSWMLTVLVI